MLPRILKLKGVALDLLFPQSCIGCGKEGDLICPACLTALPGLEGSLCPGCGRRQLTAELCPVCADRDLSIQGIRSAFRFEGIIRQAVHQLKYSNLRTLAIPLARLLADYYTAHPLPGEVIVPVPLHNKRYRERGYNQSELIARELSRLLQIPVEDECLIRQYYAYSQTRTESVEYRWQNVEHAFVCRDRRLSGKRVIVLDDVSTSGATLNACAEALIYAGADEVWGLTLAREI